MTLQIHISFKMIKFSEEFNSKKILVIGSNGYIASNLVSKLINYNCELTLLDLQSNSSFNFNSCNAKVSEVIGDIKNSNIWKKVLNEIDIIFYLAAKTNIYESIANPNEFYEINVKPIITMLEFCKNQKLKPSIVFSGTVTVYGLTNELPVNESCSENPLTIYDLHKLIVEKYLKYYSNNYGIKSVSLRLANVYGPGPSSKSSGRGVLNMMINKAINKEDLTIYGEGNFVRDYIYVDDVINAFLLSAVHIEKLKSRFFIISTGNANTVNEAFQMIANNTFRDFKLKVKNIDSPKGISILESRNFVGNSSSFSNLTGWIPKTNLFDGINKTISFFKKIK
jgi:UDP-glucose 4-epimerase